MTENHTAEGPAHADDWDSHWDDYADANADNPAQRYRRRVCLTELGRHGTPNRLLDLGSGQGDLLGDAARRWPTAELVGVEPSAAGNRFAQPKAPRARLFTLDVMEEDRVPGELLGWATHAACSEVFEHVDDDVALLRSARRLMAPGCRIVITVPGGPMSAFDRHIGHRRHYTPASLARLITDGGLEVERTAAAGFPFFNLYKSLVIARGDRLVEDAESGQQGAPASRAIQAGMLAFRPLFRLNASRSRWGWQMVGVGVAR